MIDLFSLLDTGSPITCIRESNVPQKIEKLKKPTAFRGLGGKTINMIGPVEAEVKLGNKKILHCFFVLPDNETKVPLLIGRDILLKLNIFLCQKSYKYNKKKSLFQ